MINKKEIIERALSAVSYLGWLVVIPVVLKSKQTKNIRKHLNCALTLLLINIGITGIIVPIIYYIIKTILITIELNVIITSSLTIAILSVFALVYVTLYITKWICVIRALLGLKPTLWVIKQKQFISID